LADDAIMTPAIFVELVVPPERPDRIAHSIAVLFAELH
jgi:hypothetical protein